MNCSAGDALCHKLCFAYISYPDNTLCRERHLGLENTNLADLVIHHIVVKYQTKTLTYQSFDQLQYLLLFPCLL